jgi:aspartate racemase
MKKIGIVGGVGWPSTIDYYAGICRLAEQRSPALVPEMSVESLNLHAALSFRGAPGDDASWSRWDAYYRDALQRVEASGAEVAVIASNSPHDRFEAIVSGVQIPVIDIFEVAAQECARIGAREALILGTELTMNSSRLREKFGQHGIRAQAPMEDAALAMTAQLIADLQRERSEGAQGRVQAILRKAFGATLPPSHMVCLACTELPLAFPDQKEVPVFQVDGVAYLNSTVVHLNALCEFAFDKSSA